MPCTGIDPGIKNFLFRDFLDTAGRSCETRALVESSLAKQKLFFLCTSTIPSCVLKM
jgi:hypothetical protein